MNLRQCAESMQSSGHCAALHLQQCRMEGFPPMLGLCACYGKTYQQVSCMKSFPPMYHVERLHHHSTVRILTYSSIEGRNFKPADKPIGLQCHAKNCVTAEFKVTALIA